MRLAPGSTPDQQQAMQYVADTQNRIELIRGDARLSADAKTEAIAKEWLAGRQRLEDLRAKTSTDTANRVEYLERRVFGQLGTADPAAAISYRDAQDRAANLADQQQALELLARADRGGDDVLARAVGRRAAEMGWGHVMDAFTASRATVADDLRELADINRQGALGYVVQSAMAYELPRPDELAGMSDYAVQDVANGALIH